MGLLDSWLGKVSKERNEEDIAIVFVDAENTRAKPDSIKASIESHFGAPAKVMLAYSKWSAKSIQTKIFRNSGFRLVQADSGDNNADIMMSLDAFEMARDYSERGIKGVAYICFHGDKGFTHLLEKIKAIQGWRSVWVTSNKNQSKMIQSSSSEVLSITTLVESDNDISTQFSSAPKSKSSAENERAAGSKEEYVELILSLIGDDTVTSSQLGNRIREYQTKQNWDEIGRESLFSYFGIPKRIANTSGNRSPTTLKRTIELYLPENVEITGLPPNYLFKKKENPAVIEFPAKSKYPVTLYLNSSTKGLRLPAEPRQLAEILIWLASSGADFQKQGEQRDALKEIGIIPNSRTTPTLNHIHRATKIGRFSTEQSVSMDELPGICDTMLSNCLNRSGTYSIEKEDAEKYFEEVKSTLSDLMAQLGDSA